jgi:hypothetical protein
VLAVEGRGWCGESPEEVERVVYISVVLMFTHANNLNKAADPRTLGPVSDRQDPGRTQAGPRQDPGIISWSEHRHQLEPQAGRR